jgi:glycine betaine/proline transport system substrate-binding protein
MARRALTWLLLVAAFWAAAGARAAEPEACRIVRMSDPGWSDITATNAMAGVVLAALGYEQHVDLLSVSVTFQALSRDELDVFLGNWMPAQAKQVEAPFKAGTVVRLRTNLDDGKFTLAVPSYVAESGIHSVADLAAQADQFGHHLYGIDAGSPANANIQRMIDSGPLAGWNLTESSEQGMLSQVDRAVRRHQPIVFLAWEPHTMNARFPITYLSGADAFFGPDFGHTTIDTLARKGFAADCPNLGRFFGQLSFHAAEEDALMNDIEAHKIDPKRAAESFLKANPAILASWLAGVTARDGGDARAAVERALGAS